MTLVLSIQLFDDSQFRDEMQHLLGIIYPEHLVVLMFKINK